MPKILIILALIGMTAPGRSDPRQDHAAIDPCTLCSGATKVACPTCAGKGRAALDCAMCRGVGKGQAAAQRPLDSGPGVVRTGWIFKTGP